MGANIKGPYSWSESLKVSNTVSVASANTQVFLIKNATANNSYELKVDAANYEQVTGYSPSGVARYFQSTATGLHVTNSTGGAAQAVTSALLSVSCTDSGFLPPRLTSVQRAAIGTPATGLIVYDTDLNQICVYIGSKWQKVTQTDV